MKSLTLGLKIDIYIRGNKEIQACSHTHGAYDELTTDQFSGLEQKQFLRGLDSDINWAEINGKNIYVHTPNGSHQKYNHTTNDVTVLDNDSPFYSNHPDRQ